MSGIRTVAFFSALMQYAHELGQARLGGDAALIAAAQKKHDGYKAIFLAADEAVIDLPEEWREWRRS